MTKIQRLNMFFLICDLGILIISTERIVQDLAFISIIALGLLFVFFAKGENE